MEEFRVEGSVRFLDVKAMIDQEEKRMENLMKDLNSRVACSECLIAPHGLRISNSSLQCQEDI